MIWTLTTRQVAVALLLALLVAALPAALSPAAQEAEAPETVPETETPDTPPVDGLVLVGEIDDEINLAGAAYVQRLLEQAEAEGAAAVMLELNTFGGRVDAAVLIRDALLDAKMHTAVYINKRAISAGALISLACHSIAISPGATIGAATPITTGPGQEMPEAVEEKYLSYFRQEMRVTAETRGRNGDLAEAMVDADKEVPEVSEEGELLTLTTRTALEHGFADVEAASLEEALEKLGLSGPMRRVERSWSESLVSFLTSQAIASILFLGMMVLGYLEFQTPGVGFFGFGALICFLLFYFGHYLVNLAGWEELLLVGIGVALLVVEVFVVPGFGVIGGAGLLCLLAGAVLMLLAGDWSDFTFENPFTQDALQRVATTTLLSFLVIAGLLRLVPLGSKTRLGKSLVLDEPLQAAAGYRSHERPDDALAGRTGTALTALRPAGKARIEGRRLNVETEGGFVAQGEKVRVLRQEEGRVVVRREQADA